MQMSKIGAVLLKSLKWIFVFYLICITLFGVALALSQPQSAVGWVLSITPVVIWNLKKIGLFSYRLLRTAFLFIHKRKWTAIAFWGGCFWWQWPVALIFLILLSLFKLYHIIKYVGEHGEPISDDDWDIYHYQQRAERRRRRWRAWLTGDPDSRYW